MSVKSSKPMFLALRQLAEELSPMNASELSKKLGMPMTTTLRILATLEAAGYAEREAHGTHYTIGRAARTLAFAFMSQFPIRDLSLPYLQRLTLESQQTASLFVRLGRYAVRAATVLGDGVPSQKLAVGDHRFLTVGAPSIAILAHLSEEEKRQATAQPKSPDEAGLGRAVETVLTDGFALMTCAFEPTALDMAIPIFDNRHQVIGSIAIECFPKGEEVKVTDPSGPVRQIVAELAAKASSDDAALMPHYDHISVDEIVL